MKIINLQKLLQSYSDQGINVYSTKMLEGYLSNEKKYTFRKTLNNAVKNDILERVCRGVYVYPPSFLKEIYKLEKIAIVLRMGGYSYLSLESALAEYGVISQLPLNHITVMTTGRKQTYITPYGVIEFTHTNRSEQQIIQHTQKNKDRPLRLANVELAYEDLKNVGRNLNMVDKQIYSELTNGN